MYLWLVFLHLLGLVLFLLTHGMSMWMAFRLRQTTDLAIAKALLEISSRANQVMYLGLFLLGIGGLGAAWNANLLTAGWVVASYVMLFVVLVGMWAAGAGFYYPLREALSPKDGSAPAIDAAELSRRVANRRPELLAVIGLGGLAVLVWLMVLKPF